ncbi:hypothetical protein [Arcticibacterium luteifluviistationis]|uniref:hypothetical protein n=1 Tax=Arcticibacterium luteifluviistationis TaxID=1784714 RepID=UPI0013A6BC08|nr:hypothetical protein [Arcticibacterium luteifluviistationis]
MDFEKKRPYINGELIEVVSGREFEVVSPSDHKVVAKLAWLGKQEMEKALIGA